MPEAAFKNLPLTATRYDFSGASSACLVDRDIVRLLLPPIGLTMLMLELLI